MYSNQCMHEWYFICKIQKHTDAGESAYRNDGKMLQQFQQLQY